jgi:hypothetical protein
MGLGIFLFTTASRTALGSTQPLIRCVPGALSLGVKQPGREAKDLPPSSAEIKNARISISTPPVCLHGVVLSEAQGQLYFFFYLYPCNNSCECIAILFLIIFHPLMLDSHRNCSGKLTFSSKISICWAVIKFPIQTEARGCRVSYYLPHHSFGSCYSFVYP